MSETGKLTMKVLEDAFESILRNSRIEPRHDCRFDGHVLVFNPWGFSTCMYCHESEIETDRPNPNVPKA